MSARGFQAGCLRLEPYGDADRRELYALRFHPTVRPFMANPALVSYRAHLAWCQAHLSGSGPLRLWLVRPPGGGRAIGFTQLRLEDDGRAAEIGVIFRSPARHALQAGVATAMTLAIAYRVLGCTWVRSHVAASHARAIGFNQAWGGELVPSGREGQLALALHRDACLAHPRLQRVLARWVTDDRLAPARDPESSPWRQPACP